VTAATRSSRRGTRRRGVGVAVVAVVAFVFAAVVFAVADHVLFRVVWAAAMVGYAAVFVCLWRSVR
jgi:hypothetical protein